MSHPECKTGRKQHTAVQSDKCIGKLNTYKRHCNAQTHLCLSYLGRALPAAKFQCWSNPNQLPCLVVCSRATEPQEQWIVLAQAWCRLFNSNLWKTLLQHVSISNHIGIINLMPPRIACIFASRPSAGVHAKSLNASWPFSAPIFHGKQRAVP